MFDLNELNSAASAIAGAYRLVSCACATQHTPGNDNGTILECEAILLKFRCYKQPSMIDKQHDFASMQNGGFASMQNGDFALMQDGDHALMQDGNLEFAPCLPQQAISFLPIARGSRQDQQEEEKLISQIETALMSTIADLEIRSDKGTAPLEDVEVEVSPAPTGPFRLPKRTGERRPAKDVSQLKLRDLQKPRAVEDEEHIPFIKTILTNSTRLLKCLK